MKKLFLFTMFLFITIMNIHSQSVLTGLVLNEKHSPITGAQVILSVSGKISAFATSDETGKYEIKNIDNGKYHLNVSCIGCDDHDEDIDIEGNMNKDVTLKQNAIELDSVVVTGERPRVTTSTGHIYYLSKAAAECGNPYKALQEIPDLISDYISQSVSATDGKSIMVLIDGMRVNTGIATIDPKRIASVEINDVVSSKYVKDGAEKILNIHLKPQKTLYKFIESTFTLYTPIYYHIPRIKMEVGNDKFSVYFSLDFGHTHDMESTYNSMSKSNNYIKHTEGLTKFYASRVSYVTMLKYKPTAKDYFALYFQGSNTWSHSRSKDTGTYDTNIADSTQTAADNKFSSDDLTKNRSNIYSGTLYNKHTFNNKMDIETYLTGSHNYNKMNEKTNQYYPDKSWNSINEFHTTSNTFSQSTDFSWMLNDKMHFGAGNGTTYRYYSLNEVTGTNPVFHHKQWNEYFYAEISESIKQFRYMFSMGYDFIWRSSAGIKDHYTRPNINASFTYDMKKAGSIYISFLRNSGAPQISQLNPYNTSTDSLTRSVGNPYLKPQQTYGGYLSYSRFHKGLYTSLQGTYNYISDRYEQTGHTDENGIYTTTYENLGHFHSLCLTSINSYRHKFSVIGVNLSHTVYYYPHQNAKKQFSVVAYAQHSAGKWGFTGNISYSNYSFTPISRTRSITPSGTVQVSYNFTPNIMLALGTYAIFGEWHNKTYTYSGGYESYSDNKDRNFHPYITFRWTIRKNQNKKIDLDNGIVKSMENEINLKK
jgi:hypothetical protein